MMARSYELNPRPRQFVVSEVPDPNSEPRLFVVYGDGTAEEWMTPTRAQTALETRETDAWKNANEPKGPRAGMPTR